MSNISYTINIERKGDIYEAYCETGRKIINGYSSINHGKTPLEAVENAYQTLVDAIAEEKEIDATAEIEDKWDELLSSSDSHAFLDKLGKEALIEGENGNLTPGGFDSIGEFSDELETAVKALIAMVHEGMTEREQQNTVGWIYKALAEIIVDRHYEREKEGE